MNPQPIKVTSDLLATKGQRFANFIVDIIIFYILFFIFGIVLFIVVELTGGNSDSYIETLDNTNPLVDRLITTLLLVVYYSILETVFKGRSIGKFITKTKVVRQDGSKATLNEYVIRSLCRVIPFEPFSFLFGENGKGWHDSISKTYVVDAKKFEDKQKITSELQQLGQSEETLHTTTPQ